MRKLKELHAKKHIKRLLPKRSLSSNMQTQRVYVL